jgi:hypothetical protein
MNKNTPIWVKISINPKATWKVIFDIVVVVVSIYSTFSSGYFAAFGIPETRDTQALEYIIEFIFF